MKKICNNCKSWNNSQAELEYAETVGICTNDCLRFNTSTGRSVAVLDRNNISGKFTGVQELESQQSLVPIGKVTRSFYLLVTSDDFGCINFEKK